MLKLRNKPQNYDWGKPASTSLVYKYLEAQHANDSQELDKTKPYAELWMGSHKKGESSVILPSATPSQPDSLIPLSQYMRERHNKSLPFLFKILSIQNCLSIQAHPNKPLAEQLHLSDPEHYLDDNHKPEMALALTDFKAFSNFAPGDTIVNNFERYPRLVAALGYEFGLFREGVLASQAVSEEEMKGRLKGLFLRVNQLGGVLVDLVLKDLEGRREQDLGVRDQLVKALYGQFGADVGIVVTLMMNYMELEAGQCFAMNALEPHAYFHGEIFECKIEVDCFLFISILLFFLFFSFMICFVVNFGFSDGVE